MTAMHLKNFKLLDVESGVLKTGYELLVNNDVIETVSQAPMDVSDARVLDLKGHTLMPGLIDCHIHLCAEGMRDRPIHHASLVAAMAFNEMKAMLMRGFTTLRDAGGADRGFKSAVENGLVIGPRLFVSGNIISQTGGHGDDRHPADPTAMTDHQQVATYRHIADGVSAVRRAVREEIRRGADQIKIMASGGVASISDPIDRLQYSNEELRAAVDEAERAQTYVLAHTYTDSAIRRAVEAGIRSIEHGNLIEPPTAALMAEKGAFLVPTLITYRIAVKYGKSFGFTDLHLDKAKQILEVGTRSLEIAKAAGVKMAFGTDLFRAPNTHQCEEFLVRAEALSAAEIIRSATVIGAELLQMKDRLGVIKPGAYADLLVVNGNPLEDLGVFQEEGKHIPVIIKGGALVKNDLM